MIDRPSLLETPNLANKSTFIESPVPGESVDDCYAWDSQIRGDYDGTDLAEWEDGKQVQETLPAAQWDAMIHDITALSYQLSQVCNSLWEEMYCIIHGAQAGMSQEAITQLLSGAQTFTNKTISFDSNTLTNVASLNTAQTLTNKTIAFGSNTLTDVASTNTTQTLTGKTLNLDLDTNKIYVGTANRVLVSDVNKKIVPAADTTDTEIGYVHGVTSAIQTQLDGKQAIITGAATSIISSNLTASKALISDANGKVAASSVISTELGYVSGVTSAIQTQIDGKISATSADTLKNKTLDFKDNTIKNSPVTLTTTQTLNPTKETNYVCDSAGIVITLGTAPYAGFRMYLVGKQVFSCTFNGQTTGFGSEEAAECIWSGVKWQVTKLGYAHGQATLYTVNFTPDPSVGGVYYRITGGFCYVSVIRITPNYINADLLCATGLPAPSLYYGGMIYNETFDSAGYCYIDGGTTSLILRPKALQMVWTSFAYPLI